MSLSFEVTRESNILKSDKNIIPVSKTKNYSYYDTGSNSTRKYIVKDEFKTSRFRGTSLTVNDLLYDYKSNHRLFVKGTFKNDNY